MFVKLDVTLSRFPRFNQDQTRLIDIGRKADARQCSVCTFGMKLMKPSRQQAPRDEGTSRMNKCKVPNILLMFSSSHQVFSGRPSKATRASEHKLNKTSGILSCLGAS